MHLNNLYKQKYRIFIIYSGCPSFADSSSIRGWRKSRNFFSNSSVIAKLWSMPQKVCERWFCHFQNQIGKMGHFKIFEHKKVGHFKILARDQYENWIGTENEIYRFVGISKFKANAITWQNHLSHTFWGISYYFPNAK